MRSTLKELVTRGHLLREKGLVEGYEAFQQWRQDCLNYIEAYQQRFQSEVGSPLDIEHGIHFLESNFGSDD